MGSNPTISLIINRQMLYKFQIILIMAFMASFVPLTLGADCSDNLVEIKGDWGKARFKVEIADTPKMHQQGLMGREVLGVSQGMLFVFKQPGPANFWMKDTLIPLDMLFVDETGTITNINHQAEPLSTTTYFGGRNVSFVLEINGGLAKRLGISEGDIMRHPRIKSDLAAWACNL